MSPQDRDPTRDELLAMAYVDGELADDARREFEARLADSSALRAEVAEQRGLAVLARELAPPEPMDHEWERLEREWLHRGGGTLGLTLVGVGAAGLTACALGWILTADVALVPKVCAAAVAGGALLLLLVTLRARLKTLPFDPYTKVKR